MEIPADLPRDVPFSISCFECSCDSPDSLEEAAALGWVEIMFYPEGLGENFMGYCPRHAFLTEEPLAEPEPSDEPVVDESAARNVHD